MPDAAAGPAATGSTAGLWRRLAAILYDSLLLIGVLLVATAPLLPLTGGRALSVETVGRAGYLGYQFYLLLVAFLFFAVSWTRGGQTLGMKAWKIRLVARRTGADGAGPAVGWGRAMVRFVAALVSWAALGLGFFWVWIDRDRLAWHDRWSGTRLVRLAAGRARQDVTTPD